MERIIFDIDERFSELFEKKKRNKKTFPSNLHLEYFNKRANLFCTNDDDEEDKYDIIKGESFFNDNN